MAKRENQEQTIFKTEEERIAFEQKYKKELSAGSYAKERITEIVVSLGSAGLGGAIGWFAAGDGSRFGNFAKKSTKKATDKLSGTINKKVNEATGQNINEDFTSGISDKVSDGVGKTSQENAKYVLATIGAFVGLMVGGIILGYKHWRREESQRLAVEELNRDISNIKLHNKTDDELVKRNESLREMYEDLKEKTSQLEPSKAANTIVSRGPKSPMQHSQEASMQTGIGAA